MFTVLRLRSDDPLDRPLTALATALGARPGFRSAEHGAALEDPTLWSLVTRWEDVGSYRRALSAYEVKLAFGPVQHLILDEPGAFDGPGVTY